MLEKSLGAQQSENELGLIEPGFFQFCCQIKDITQLKL